MKRELEVIYSGDGTYAVCEVRPSTGSAKRWFATTLYPIKKGFMYKDEANRYIRELEKKGIDR